MLTEFGKKWTEVGQRWPGFGHFGPKFNLGQILLDNDSTEFVKLAPKLAKLLARSEQRWPMLAQVLGVSGVSALWGALQTCRPEVGTQSQVSTFGRCNRTTNGLETAWGRLKGSNRPECRQKPSGDAATKVDEMSRKCRRPHVTT